jgi:hypothetical protein
MLSLPCTKTKKRLSDNQMESSNLGFHLQFLPKFVPALSLSNQIQLPPTRQYFLIFLRSLIVNRARSDGAAIVI